ncbi:hypothetical protein V5O48_000243 [Marasmius crinis-equi]|uniref:Uncharacterized protein n=1 Tax=Marasmius crinis-equi TaxID=585013 RepID=A0ABR3G1R2_9AGAR
MKLASILSTICIASGVALGQETQGYGFVSPIANQVVNITENPNVNLTFNPYRYFKESTRNIDVFILSGNWSSDFQDTYTHPHVAQELVTGLEPNIDYQWSGITTPAYHANLYIAGLPTPVPGSLTVMVRERYNGFGPNSTMAFYSQRIQVTK